MIFFKKFYKILKKFCFEKIKWYICIFNKEIASAILLLKQIGKNTWLPQQKPQQLSSAEGNLNDCNKYKVEK